MQYANSALKDNPVFNSTDDTETNIFQKKINRKIGTSLKRIRTSNGLSRDDMAGELGAHANTIRNIENGGGTNVAFYLGVMCQIMPQIYNEVGAISNFGRAKYMGDSDVDINVSEGDIVLATSNLNAALATGPIDHTNAMEIGKMISRLIVLFDHFVSNLQRKFDI